ncbi:hypothetical protein ACQPZ8_28195 [Actinomadura nitritigenes]|uniref:hypothetical protein n=1 Tax=Actinomadura nitritigenes TaxID=134602 RepID=UPI003D8AE7F2
MANSAVPDRPVIDVAKSTVSPHLTRLLVRAGMAAGLDRSRLAGLPGSPSWTTRGSRIPTGTILRVWEMLSRLPWGARGGDRVMELWQPGALGVWDYIFPVSGTLEEGFRAAARHFTAIADPSDELCVTRELGGRPAARAAARRTPGPRVRRVRAFGRAVQHRTRHRRRPPVGHLRRSRHRRPAAAG